MSAGSRAWKAASTKPSPTPAAAPRPTGPRSGVGWAKPAATTSKLISLAFRGTNIDACAAALPPALAGEGWGGGKPHAPSPGAFAFAEASAERGRQVAVPERRPYPTLPREEREREREDNARGWKRQVSRN